MKKILLTLALLGVGVSGVAAAQSDYVVPPAATPYEQSIYSQGMYRWAIRNEPRLGAYLSTLMKIRDAAFRMHPDAETANRSKVCEVSANVTKDILMSQYALVNAFIAEYGPRFPQFAADLRNQTVALTKFGLACDRQDVNDLVNFGVYMENVNEKIFAK